MPDPKQFAPTLFLIAGESSGDILGGRLIAALKAKTGSRFRYRGIGGPAMIQEGLETLFPMAELSLMGLVEIVPHLPRLLRRLDETVAAIKAAPPAALITIDAPSFGLRVSRRIAGLDVPRIHYVAPQLWAWRAGRGKNLARSTDHLLALLPFEPAFFRPFAIDCRFVGHPVVENAARKGDPAIFRQHFNLGAEQSVLLMLAGSRVGEVRRLLPIFAETLRRARPSLPDNLTIVMPTVPHLRNEIEHLTRDWAPKPIIFADAKLKYDAFAAARAALAASGTVTLELAIAGVPTVVAYRFNALSTFLARRFSTVTYVSLANILLAKTFTNGPLWPEYLLEDCEPGGLSKGLIEVFNNVELRDAQRAAASSLLSMLGRDGNPPSMRAADEILQILSDREKNFK